SPLMRGLVHSKSKSIKLEHFHKSCSDVPRVRWTARIFSINALIQKFALNLLQRFAFCFRQFHKNVKETNHADDCVKPERASRAELAVQQWERVGQNETRNPQCC